MSATDQSELSFEAAVARLEKIVEEMEAGEVPLAESVTKFEEGSKLLKICEKRLSEAELKIEKLKSSGNETAFEPIDTDPAES